MNTDYNKFSPTSPMRNPHLHRLSELKDYKVASRDPDVRGWTVRSNDNQPIGKVEELIVDTQSEKVRYLVVDVDPSYAADSHDHYMLVPIGAARLDTRYDDVRLSSISGANCTNYPVYRGKDISREYENSIRRFYESGGTAPQGSEVIRDVHSGEHYYSSKWESDKIHPVPTNRSNMQSPGVSDSHGPSAEIGSGSSIPRETPASGNTGFYSARTPESHHIDDRSQAESNSIRGDRDATDRSSAGSRTFGTSNLNTGSDLHDRLRTHGLPNNRTSGLQNKDIEPGPAGLRDTSDRDQHGQPFQKKNRVYDSDSDPNFRSTSDLNRSTSLSNKYREGSNADNLQRQPKPLSPPDRAPEPSARMRRETASESEGFIGRTSDRHSLHTPNETEDTYYNGPTYDESHFYGDRRRRE